MKCEDKAEMKWRNGQRVHAAAIVYSHQHRKQQRKAGVEKKQQRDTECRTDLLLVVAPPCKHAPISAQRLKRTRARRGGVNACAFVCVCAHVCACVYAFSVSLSLSSSRKYTARCTCTLTMLKSVPQATSTIRTPSKADTVRACKTVPVCSMPSCPVVLVPVTRPRQAQGGGCG